MLFENIKDKLSNGHIVNARLGRAGRNDVKWHEPKDYTLYIQKFNGRIVVISPSADWAEYSIDDYCGNNLFLCEDYYMEILDWRTSNDG